MLKFIQKLISINQNTIKKIDLYVRMPIDDEIMNKAGFVIYAETSHFIWQPWAGVKTNLSEGIKNKIKNVRYENTR
jgi:hypothetical protein